MPGMLGGADAGGRGTSLPRGAVVEQPETGFQSEVATRQRLLSLLDQLETASPFDSSSLAEEVRQHARRLRSLKRSA
jgi:hypothetical protein